MSNYELKIFAGSASSELAQKIAQAYGVELGKSTLIKFKDGEIQPRFLESIRGKNVYLVQSTYPPAEHIMELLLMIDAAKRASAHEVVAVIPYFGYARQDRKDDSRLPISAKVMADLITAVGATRVVTMDLHAGQIQGFFNIPVDNLHASAVFIPYFKSMNLENLVVVSPDLGGIKRARRYAEWLNAELALMYKHRERPNEVATMQLIGNVENKNVLLVDDIVDTAGTLCKAAEVLKSLGAQRIIAAITHPLLSENAVERIEQSPIEKLYVTDTIPLRKFSPKIEVLSIATIFAEALRKIHHYESVSSLFLT